MTENGESRTVITFKHLENTDTIKITVNPEKKGIFIKHVEYVVMSQRFCSSVCRRYNDFVVFYELLLSRFPYRLVPKLPPKKMVGVFPGDAGFLENRRRGLQRWLTLVSRHPVISEDSLLSFFLTQNLSDLQSQMRDIFKSIPDEFSTSELAAKANTLVSSNNNNDFASTREQIRVIHFAIHKIKLLADQMTLRSHGYSTDMGELGKVLNDLGQNSGGRNDWGTGGNSIWKQIRSGLTVVSKEFISLSTKANEQCRTEQEEVCERLDDLLEILTGHQEMCERVEKGVSHDHQSALSKMLALKKRQIQGVLKGSDAESVAALENRMLQQEHVIASVELRTSFSLYCVQSETALVQVYLGTLAQILNSLVEVQISSHTELAKIWKIIQPTISECLPRRD